MSRMLFNLSSVFAIAISWMLFHHNSTQTRFLVGVTAVDINLPQGKPMAGYYFAVVTGC